MALKPGDQDGNTGVFPGPGTVTVPKGCVVNVIEVIMDAAAGKVGGFVNVQQFAPALNPIFVPAGVAYKDEPDRYVGDGVKQIIFTGDFSSWDVTWKVL